MPKALKGHLIECDPPQMAMILKVDRESNNAYVIDAIDDRVCFVRSDKVEELKARVKTLMDAAMGLNDQEEEDKDSDLE